jgi:hypothetical protein
LLLAGSASAADRAFDPGKLGSSIARSSSALAPPFNDNGYARLWLDEETEGSNADATVAPNELLTYNDPDRWGCTADGDEGPTGWPMRNTILYWIPGAGRTVTLYAAGADVDSIVTVRREDGELAGCNDDVLPGAPNWSALRFRRWPEATTSSRSAVSASISRGGARGPAVKRSAPDVCLSVRPRSRRTTTAGTRRRSRSDRTWLNRCSAQPRSRARHSTAKVRRSARRGGSA